ncbi:hypothetical protein VNI00_002309 [Paramarasmius palmivorus]|uniref:Uncharacterized protein n=1 Tax=Paramarasmius palmivorus TaxID=297713 RepID=A0AAW0E187_9AGAR
MYLKSSVGWLQQNFGDVFGLETITLALAALLCGFLYVQSNRQKKGLDVASSNEKKDGKQNGEWIPMKFDYPSFPPCNEELRSLKPVPYRPFRWGAYHVTMGIRAMPWSEWIEVLFSTSIYHSNCLLMAQLYSSMTSILSITQSKSIVFSQGGRMFFESYPTGLGWSGLGGTVVLRFAPIYFRAGSLSPSIIPAIELVHELAEYLTKRYPTTFIATRDSSRAIKSVKIVPVDATLELPLPLLQDVEKMVFRDVSLDEAEEALRVSSLLESKNSPYAPGVWRLRDKIGLPLDEIHTSGHVPQYPEKLQVSLERFFKRMPVEKPVVRNNYFFQIVKPDSRRRTGAPPSDIPPQKEDEDLVDPGELAWSRTMFGNEDTYAGARAPDEVPEVAPETMRFRTERQTLRRLPLTGAIVFTIRPYVVPLPEMCKEKGVPARLASAVRSWPEDIAGHRGRDYYGSVLLDYLDGRANEQRKQYGDELEKLTEYPY